MTWIGERVRPIDWEARTAGGVRYTADLDLPGTLIGKILRSPHPYAEIIDLDVSAAERLPGVRAVITMADFEPGARYIHRGHPLSDRPPLADGVVRHVGQEVAAVAADSAAIAAAAINAIRVRYRVRRAPLTPGESLRARARRLHERTSGEPNVSVLSAIDWGDVEAGRRAGVVSVHGRYVYPSVSHACMETNTTLASWDAERGCVELWTSTQAPWFIAKEVSHLLGIAHEQVICREVAVGGGFGSKSKASEHEVLAAALSRKAGRPVLVELTRDEEFGANKPRHRFETTLTTSADRDGIIRLFEADLLVDNGSYNHMGSSVMRVGLITLGSMYRPDGVSLTSRLVDTATQPGGQFRGYGTPQVSLAVESQVDELAERLGVDPLDLRLRNTGPEFAPTLCGYEVTTSRLGDCLESVRAELRWDERKAERIPDRGVGVAAGMHGSGAFAYEQANRSDAAIDVFSDGRVRVRHGSADAGTGQNTILAQVAASELGIAVTDVEVVSMDSERTPFELGAWSSRGTHMTGSSVGKAAREMADMLRAVAAQKLGTDAVELRDGRAVSENDAVDLGDLVELSDDAVDGCLSHETSYLLEGTEMITPGKDRFNLSPSYAFAAHGAVVDVDRRTGKVSVIDYVAAHDVGTAINPTATEGQIVGGAVMGLGAALGEELIREGGRIVNTSYLHYALPRSADLPSVRPVIVNGSDPAGPYGAKSVGEMSIIPPGAAIANAVYDAVGVRITDLPITPDKILTALAQQEGRRRRHRLWRRPSRWWVSGIRALYPLGLHTILHRYGTKLGRGVGHRGSTPAEEPRIIRARTDDELTSQLGRDARPVGGMTDALVARRSEERPAPVLISTIGIPARRAITVDERGALRIGAAVTLAELADHLRDRLPFVSEAIDSIASPQIRNTATVGGNLAQEKRCWFFRNGFACYKRNGATSPCYAVEGDHRFQHAVIDGHRCQAVTPSDLGTVLASVDAEVVVGRAGGRRTLRIGELYSGPGELSLEPGEVILEIVIGAEDLDRQGGFAKLSLYHGDFATASATITALGKEGRLRDVRIVLGAVAPTPWRARETERALEGTVVSRLRLRAELDAELDRIAHPLPRNGWKLDAVAGLAEQALEQGWPPGWRGSEDAALC
ncbi:molybdopterin-dependent oxidoreductase [Aeromicrobium sp. YIM 150415]|uniref:molybdopterin cofactor-binding domain-containing protein n=1 Tax=Aeromicrobium sp. YIM 150415 TaxID=2803912 RepID=UPI001963B9D3|nr:molybdopterin cofactor-binding domain-containing protein [Aeromicrobium sp. YIM 150415]MBM9464178.1 molybdopterin-dependent oxidoreductase [Aeromicrobium sp. YIM 150415]